MNLTYFSIQSLKDKFATLISTMVSSLGMTLEQVSELILRNSYFDFMEKNEAQSFLDENPETILKTIFGHEIHVDPLAPILDIPYWAAYQAINVSIVASVPLKQIVLLFPLPRMASFFQEFHERGEKDFVRFYLEEAKKQSILKSCLDGMSLMTLSHLSGIKLPTIMRLLDNEALFRTSFQNVDTLSSILDKPLSLFRQESLFIPLDETMFRIPEFVNSLLNELPKIMGMRKMDGESIEIVHGQPSDAAILVYLPYQEPDIKEIRRLTFFHRAIVTLSTGMTVYKKSTTTTLDASFLALFKKIAKEVLAL
ncbi:MAG: hypothetical protein IJS37_00690 [Bacilli bacterium]|nr:hypothetical protein [Bacilli bacterium]